MALKQLILDCDNRYVVVKGAGTSSRLLMKAIDDAISYRVEGFQFAPSFKEKKWDGKDHLLKLNRQTGQFRFPLGLLEDVSACLREQGVDFSIQTSRQRQPDPKIVFTDWNPEKEPRPYQLRAVEALVAAGGSGILQMAIRSGKTLTAGRAFHVLGGRSLFIVPSQLLLHQTCKSLRECLGLPVGVIGEGSWSVEDITVATVQTLFEKRSAGDKRYFDLAKSVDTVVFDEVHHVKGSAWRSVMMDMDARHKIGLSATVLLEEDKREWARGSIWLKACCGPVRYVVEASDLIDGGFLMSPTIWLVPVREPKLPDEFWSPSLQDSAVYENDYRNRAIVSVAREMVHDLGLKTLVITNRLKHVALLGRNLVRGGFRVGVITGKDKHDLRMKKIDRFVKGSLDVLVSTVFGEGVDVPEIEGVINAEGGRDNKSTVQRMRNLTPFAGKSKCIFADMMDLTSPYFARHSHERLAMYRKERSFKLEAHPLKD